MHWSLRGVVVIALCTAVACSGGGGAAPTTPSAPPQPVPPSGPPQPPTVNINGQWEGTYRHDTASGTMKFYFFDQNGKSSVDGQFDLIGEPEGERVGAIAGTLSGNVLTFSYGYGMNCVRTITGTATFASSGFLSNRLTGTFSGSSTCGDRYTNGRFDLPIQRPTPGPLVDSKWFGQTGTTQTPGIFGSNSSWLWQINQLTPVTDGFTVAGSVTQGAGAPPPALVEPHSTGPLSGLLTYVGLIDTNGNGILVHRWRLESFSIALSGRCPSSLSGRTTPPAYFGAQVPQLAVVLNGTTCSQTVSNFTTSLSRQ